ncbi:MAG: MauE/DoxX family redox-associated membrane protein [Bacteroidota bacterium]
MNDKFPALVLLQFLLYFLAGINHFINPQFYLKLIPPYIPFHEAMNVISGIAEIVLALLLLHQPARKFASVIIVLMLLVFITVHVYYIQVNPCTPADCIFFGIGWARLLIVHPLLIYWAWKAGSLAGHK